MNLATCVVRKMSKLQELIRAHRKSIISCRVSHVKREKYDIYIGRPSKWGNPFTHIKTSKTLAKYIVDTREEAISKYEEWLTSGDGSYLLSDLHELENKTLGCWCKPKSCHGDVLVKLVLSKKY